MFEFLIPNKKIPIYLTFAYGIIIINLIAFFALSGIKPSFGRIEYLFVIGLLLLIGRFIWDYRRYRRKGVAPVETGFLLLGTSVFWLGTDYSMVMLLGLLLGVLYFISIRKLKIVVGAEGVFYPSFPTRVLNWSELSNVILKDGLLTIDLENNKIYQHLIEYPAKEVNEAEFNDFCRKQLMVHGS